MVGKEKRPIDRRRCSGRERGRQRNKIVERKRESSSERYWKGRLAKIEKNLRA